MVENKSKRKRNFIIYYFLVKRKPNERIDLLITTSMNILVLQIRAGQWSITANLQPLTAHIYHNDHCDRWLFQEIFF